MDGDLGAALARRVWGVWGVLARKYVGFHKHQYRCEVFSCVWHITRGATA